MQRHEYCLKYRWCSRTPITLKNSIHLEPWWKPKYELSLEY